LRPHITQQASKLAIREQLATNDFAILNFRNLKIAKNKTDEIKAHRTRKCHLGDQVNLCVPQLAINSWGQREKELGKIGAKHCM
jgi:hypothetical protein